jgi:hypothetical protein
VILVYILQSNSNPKFSVKIEIYSHFSFSFFSDLSFGTCKLSSDALFLGETIL